MNLRVDTLYIPLDGKDKRASWARSHTQMETVILDYDQHDQLIGIELLGSAARAAIDAVNALPHG